jgi:hypothetical protein
MLGPFDPVAVSAAISSNLATDILKNYARKLSKTKFGGALAKLGLLRPEFDDRLNSVLQSTILDFFNVFPQYRVSGFVEFLKDPETLRDVSDYILNGVPYDRVSLVLRMATYLDVPKNLPPSVWPNFNPDVALSHFFTRLDSCLGVDADPAMIWISRQLAALREEMSKTLEAQGELILTIDSQPEAIRDFESRYLSHQKYRVGKLTTPGARELHGVNQSLSVAYISLRLIPLSQVHQYMGSAG